MPANLENSAVATGLKRSVFTPTPKKGNVKESSTYGTIALISHASKVMLKTLNRHPNFTLEEEKKKNTKLVEGRRS